MADDRRCHCQNPQCLGPAPGRPEVRHRTRARVIGREGRYVRVLPEGVDFIQGSLLLLAGYQIDLRDAKAGKEGWLEYRSTPSSGLHYFTEQGP